MTREELQRLYDECRLRAFRAEQLAGLVRGVESFLAEPDPTVEIAELLAEVDEAQAEAHNAQADYDRRGERLWRLAALAGWTPDEADNDATAELYIKNRLAEVRLLARWKNEALPVIAGLQELGAALGIPLGKHITGPDALEAVKALTARAEAAEQTNQRVRAIHYAADNDLARTPVCSNCEGKAGVHDCGCWADEDRQPVCGHCNEGWKGASVPWPCATVRALDGGEQHG